MLGILNIGGLMLFVPSIVKLHLPTVINRQDFFARLSL